ncbi:DUF3440 domain-containing protein [Fusobacterium necrophorum]|uniref:DUF3440 domain-containing protein n=1 Tax=Fusobacterium necrophorum TaxID=859 RepID=UPI00373AF271
MLIPFSILIRILFKYFLYISILFYLFLFFSLNSQTIYPPTPTYKRMCIAILKNDTSCKTLGFGQTKYELEKRKNIMEKYRNL